MAIIDQNLTQDGGSQLYSGYRAGYGQSFTGDSSGLAKVTFKVNKSGSPSGNAYAKLYAHSGTFGTSSVPDTGNLLATSNPVDASTFPSSAGDVEFTFSSPYTVENGVHYVVTLEWDYGDSGNYINIYRNGSSIHDGNGSVYISAWNAISTQDAYFICESGGAPPPEPQYGRPDSDVSAGAWSPSTGSDLFACVDEEVANDTDYIDNTGGSSTCEVGLSDLSDPNDHTNHVLRVRNIKTGGGAACTAYLIQGTTQIASLALTMGGGFATDEYTLSEAEAANITDYTDLRVRLIGSKARVSWIELETPGVSGTLNYQSASGVFTFGGGIVLLPKKKLSGSLTSSGSVSKLGSFYRSLAGAFNTVGSITKKSTRSLVGAFDFSGTLAKAKKFFTSLAGAFSFAGDIAKLPKKKLAGALDSAGTLKKLTKTALVGAFDFAGDAARKALKTLSGAFDFAGNAAKKTLKVLSGVLDSSGSILKKVPKSLAGSFDFAGLVLKKTIIDLAGVFSAVGQAIGQKIGGITYKAVYGAFDFSGLVAKKTSKTFAGVLDSVGSITKKAIRTLSGTFNFLGDVAKLPKKVLDGAFDSLGAVVRFPKKKLAGAFDSSGSILRKTYKTFAGAFDFAGSILKWTTRSISGVLSFVGEGIGQKLAGIVYKSVSGAFDFVGDITRLPKKKLAGSFDSAGVLGRKVYKLLAGTLTSVGNVARQFIGGLIQKSVGGILTFSGAIKKKSTRLLGGVFGFAGSIKKLIRKLLYGQIGD